MANKGLPPDGEIQKLEDYKGWQTRAPRAGIDDNEFSVLENLFPVDKRNLRAVYGPSTALYTASGGRTIVYFKPFNISTVYYHFVVLSDGSAIAVRISNGAVTIIAAAGTFTTPYVAQWASTYLMIIDPTKGYFIWDGTTLYSPGGSAPAAFGGTMPTGINGTYLEIFQSRVWIVNNNILTYSAPSLATNFATLGGGSAPSTDSFLAVAYYGVKQTNGFLYPFGDSSVNVISNVQTISSITTFNNSNVDPQAGTSWPWTIEPFGRALVFANQSGIYALYGGAAEKISNDLDGVFSQSPSPLGTPIANFAAPVPSCAVGVLFGIKCLFFLFNTYDAALGANRTIMAAWDGKKWYAVSQGINNITQIATQKQLASSSVWGTDGSSIYQFFTTASINLTKKFSSRLWYGKTYVQTKNALRLGVLAFSNVATQPLTFTYTIDSENPSITVPLTGGVVVWVNNLGAAVTWINNSSQTVTWASTQFAFQAADTPGQSGKLLGLSFTSNSADFTIVSQSLEYVEWNLW
jgi:hypothetical protein